MAGFLESIFPSIAKGRLYQIYNFDRHYRGETPFGFVAPYRLHGHLKVVDENEFFEATRHSTQGAQGVVNLMVDHFHDVVFLSLIEKHQLFFYYHLNRYQQIILDFWQYDEREDEIKVAWNPYYGAGGIEKSVDQAMADFRRDGCVIQVLLVDFEPYQTTAIEENTRMIRPKVLAAIRESGSHLKLLEQFCVAALAERAALFRDVKTHGQSETTIRTQIVGDALKLSWKNEKADAGWKLLGFRKTGGFAPDETSETQNGLLVVDSARREGETVEAALPRKEPVYYTFFLKKQEKSQKLFEEEKTFFRYEPVARFSETIPDQDTVQALAKQLEETRLKAQIAEAERRAEEMKKGKANFADERRASMEGQLRLAKDALGLLSAVDGLEADALAELDRSPDRFTAERAEAWRDEVTDLCAKLRENVRGLV